MSKSKFGKIGIAVCCSACLGLNATAQDQANPQTAPRQEVRAAQQPGVGQNAGQVQNAGHQQGMGQAQNLIANCLVHDNQAEIILGRMAQDKSESGAVKKFAGMMVEDHQAILTKLQKFAPNAGDLSQNHGDARRSGTEGIQTGQDRDKQDRPNQSQPGPGQNQAGQNQANNQNAGQQIPGQMNDPSMIAVKLQNELAQQCLSDAQAKLMKQDGEKFDKCYIGMQIVAHAAMKSKLTVFARHAQGELKQLIDQGLQTTEKHLDEAESIMKDLDGKSSGAEGRSTDRSSSNDKSEKR